MPSDPRDFCVLSLQKFPKELKRKLKMKAAERDIDLQHLCAQYLQAGLDKEESEKPAKVRNKP